MLTPRRMSTAPSAVSPLGANIPRPGSAAGQTARPNSAASHFGHARNSNTSEGTDSDSADSKNVRVVVRIRPSLADDSVPMRLRNVLIHPTSSADLRIDVDPAQLTGNAGLTNGAKRHPTFTFDHVLGEESNQTDLYDVTAKDVVEEYLKGHNVTFLASGKSYSMGTTGEDIDYSGSSFTPRTGLIPRTVRAIFDRAEEIRIASGSGSSWECRLSFLELYNEEIIDLLSGAGVQITIREERDGRIIWSGVREVKVRTLGEVMQLLQDGAARRQTGETGMNATSSRSHAIFSLTMVQKKRAGMSISLSQSISPPGTPKTLKRPASSIGLPRSNTPSGSKSGPPIVFGQKQSGIPRPASMLGHREDEFVIVTSKFNMVDLAGSERLKRTAAQGERMKEGISINSGLSALGNVISALSDPKSAKGHIPYRDSKLTRMLQDSIGGNALTTMIACVSPIEYNVAETLNTIKYASRARNIKNTSKVNAVEAGWDDVEHLQTTILKLRKQIANLDMDGSVVGAPGMAGRALPADAQRQSEKLIQRLAELQREHTELYDRYLAKCNENMRLTSELKSATPGDADVLARFNETVEPVILEYEKVVTALNMQLDDLRAQLSLLDTLYEEQGRGLVESQERTTQSESYAAELRARASKLHDQNSSNESYIADLEAKLKTYTDASDGHSEAAVELKKEITKLKATNASLTQHSIEIEARLSQSEDKTATLLHQIERLEMEVAQRETSYNELESRIALLDTSQDNKLLLAELEERGRQVAALESERSEAEAADRDERERLVKLLEAERNTQEDLRRQLAEQAIHTPPASQLADSSEAAGNRSVISTSGNTRMTPPPTPEHDGASDDEVARLNIMIDEISKKASDAEDRYSAAQARVEELQIQLVEVREANDILPITPAISLTNMDDAFDKTSPGHSPPLLRSKRGSLPILSSTGFATKGAGTGFRGGRGYGESRQSRPQSLSQELFSVQQSLISPRGSLAGTNSLLFGPSPSKQSLPTIKPLRSSTSSDLRLHKATETELKFVHKVVKERDEELRQKDAYIRQLESSLSLQQQKQHAILSRQPSASSLHPQTIPLPPSPENDGIALPSDTSDDSFNQPGTPSTDDHGGHAMLRATSNSEPEFYTPAEEMHDPLEYERAIHPTESMLEMQKKEASQRQIIEQQFMQIADLQKANLRLRDEIASGYPHTSMTPSSSRSPVTPKKTLISPFASPSAELNKLRDEHAEELRAIITGHSFTIEALQKDCDERISALEKQIETMLESYERQVIQLRAQHTSDLGTRQTTHDEVITKMRKDAETMNAEVNASLASHDEARRQLKMKADQALFELSRIRDESQMQRNADAKHIADLLQAKANLEEAIDELEVSKVDWMKRNGELEQRYSRKIVGQPPQGPPPNMPLPPTPSANALVATAAAPSRIMERTSSNSGSSNRGHGRSSDELSRVQDIDAAVPLLPLHIGQMIQAVMLERDRVAAEARTLQRQLEEKLAVSTEAEQHLTSQLGKTQSLSRELVDARKTSSKLRAHLEDSRNETRRQQDECKAHMDELNERRQQVTKVEEHKRSDRDSLLSANAQVAALKAQLEKAVDAKVNKKMGSKLKCF